MLFFLAVPGPCSDFQSPRARFRQENESENRPPRRGGSRKLILPTGQLGELSPNAAIDTRLHRASLDTALRHMGGIDTSRQVAYAHRRLKVLTFLEWSARTDLHCA